MIVINIVFLIILLFLSGFFSATETAFTSLNMMQLREIRNQKNFRAKLVYKLAKKPDVFLGTTLLGNNIVNISAATITATLIIKFFGSSYTSIGTLLLTLLILIFGEVTPKQIALSHNEFIAKNSAPFIFLLAIIFRPFTFLVVMISNFFVKLIPGKNKKNISLEGIIHMVNLAEDDGVLEEYENDMVKNVFRLNDIPVSSIITHRKNVFSLNHNLTVAEAKKELRENSFSRIPIYKDDPENIVGIALAKDILLADENKILKDLAGIPIYISEGKKVSELFGLFKIRADKMAIVLDEYGGLEGIVTQEDVIEEIFGELYDEDDIRKTETITQLNFDTFLLKGELSCDQFAEEFNVSIKNSKFSFTLGGYISERLERIPKEGDTIFVENGKLIVKQMDNNKVNSIIYKIATKKTD